MKKSMRQDKNSDSAKNEVLIGGIEKRDIVVVNYDPLWPGKYELHARAITAALGKKALAIEHVGSTSVPMLVAKPIIDIIVIVENSGDENEYVSALIAAGYVMRVREPDWHEHRMLRTPELDVHVHIFSRGCPEVQRQLAFRDRLRKNPEDRNLYASTKRKLVEQDWPDMNAYARAKSEVVELITKKALKDLENDPDAV